MKKQSVETEKKIIPFSNPDLGEEEISEVVDSLQKGWLTTGPKVERFERELKEYLDCEHVLALSSCSAALHLALEGLNVGPGDEVITSPLTFISTISSIMRVGAVPVLADVEERNLTIDSKQIREKITGRTKAILPVHYGGYPCQMNEIFQLARDKGLLIIEDAAHAIGSNYQGIKIGALETDAACFSFYATKNLAIGEGGALATPHKELADRAKILSLHGMDKDAWDRYEVSGNALYDILDAGYKYNMTDIQAAIGIHQLKKLDGMTQARRQIADWYLEELKDFRGLKLPERGEAEASSWHLFPIRLPSEAGEKNVRNQVAEELKSRGIGTSVHFIPVFLFSYMKKNYDFKEKDFPVAMKAFSEILSLPVYPKMTGVDVQFVCRNLKEILNNHG